MIINSLSFSLLTRSLKQQSYLPKRTVMSRSGGHLRPGKRRLFPRNAAANGVEVETCILRGLNRDAQVLAKEGRNFDTSFFYVENHRPAAWEFAGGANSLVLTSPVQLALAALAAVSGAFGGLGWASLVTWPAGTTCAAIGFGLAKAATVASFAALSAISRLAPR